MTEFYYLKSNRNWMVNIKYNKKKRQKVIADIIFINKFFIEFLVQTRKVYYKGKKEKKIKRIFYITILCIMYIPNTYMLK